MCERHIKFNQFCTRCIQERELRYLDKQRRFAEHYGMGKVRMIEELNRVWESLPKASFDIESPLVITLCTPTRDGYKKEIKTMRSPADIMQELEITVRKVHDENDLLKETIRSLQASLNALKAEKNTPVKTKLPCSLTAFKSGEHPWSKATVDHWIDSSGSVQIIAKMPSPYIKNCLVALRDRYGKGFERHICVPEMVRILVERGDL